MPTLHLVAVRRGIAQSGSAPALGAGCREFESLYPDQIYKGNVLKDNGSMVIVAQLVEPRTVIPVVVGSIPIGHPNSLATEDLLSVLGRFPGGIAQLDRATAF